MKLFIILILFSLNSFARPAISGRRLQLITGVNKPQVRKAYWDSVYKTDQFIYGKKPSKFLVENSHYIPYGAKVLDVGMGEGRHAVYLAQQGYDVTGVDISPMAIKKAEKLAKEFNVNIKTIASSIEKFKITPESFDAIVCFYYVDRKILGKLKRLLKPGGVLLYEAHTIDEKKVNKKLTLDPDSYFLKPGELLSLFPGNKVLKYEEPLHERAFRASVIVQKTKKNL